MAKAPGNGTPTTGRKIEPKVCILNGSGNVGKTTIAAHLLYPRLTAQNGVEPTHIELETHNYSASSLPGIKTVKKDGKQYRDVYAAAFEPGALIVDVGASNIAAFLHQMNAYKGSEYVFGFFVLPVTPGDKEIRDTLSTIKTLHAFGISAERLRVVFNRVRSDDGHRPFQLLYDAAAMADFAFPYDERLTIYESDLFRDLGEIGETVQSILADPTDDDRLIRETEGLERQRHIQRSLSKRLAGSVSANLDAVFAALAEKM